MEAGEFPATTRMTENSAYQRKKKDKNAKRFTDDQIRSLESIFKLDTKLEPRKKLQLASDLGLQPRQVAIWFQNKRARWKSKQIEQEYRVLKESFDRLNEQFECLKKERESLLIQLRRLNGQMNEPHERSSKHDEDDFRRNAAGSDLEDTNVETERDAHVDANGENRGATQCFAKKEEAESLDMGQLGDSSLELAEQWCNLGSVGGPFDQCCDTSKQWWDF